MKVFLALSLMANAILGYLLVTREEAVESVESAPMERLIIETHADAKKPKPKPKTAAIPKGEKKREELPPETEEKFTEEPLSDFRPLHEDEFSMAVDKMEQDRTNFFYDELNLPMEFMTQYQELRRQHEESIAKMWASGGEPSFEDREKMLKLEKQYHDELVKLFGEENWKRYNKFRDNYNNRSQKQSQVDRQPYIYMQP